MQEGSASGQFGQTLHEIVCKRFQNKEISLGYFGNTRVTLDLRTSYLVEYLSYQRSRKLPKKSR